MASSASYLQFVLELLSPLGNISHRKMMGEYLLYHDGKLIGGIYDDRLLLKPAASAVEIMKNSSFGLQTDVPYDGAKEMLVADVDDPELTLRAAKAVSGDLTGPKNWR